MYGKKALRKLHTVFEKRKEDEKRVHEEQINELYDQMDKLTRSLHLKKSGIDI